MSPAETITNPETAALNDCWNRIGVFGDRSCEQLSTHVHCRNCPVYSAAGRSLLQRLPPDNYLAEWTTLLAEGQQTSGRSLLSADGAAVRNERSLSLMVFRLAEELFALPVAVLLEVSAPYVVHSIPQRSNAVFRGLVNIRGEIMLVASLTALLGLADQNPANGAPTGSRRMAVASSSSGRWVFPLDEVFGIHLFDHAAVRSAPLLNKQATTCYSSGVLQWRNRSVALLDPELIFSALNDTVAAR